MGNFYDYLQGDDEQQVLAPMVFCVEDACRRMTMASASEIIKILNDFSDLGSKAGSAATHAVAAQLENRDWDVRAMMKASKRLEHQDWHVRRAAVGVLSQI